MNPTRIILANLIIFIFAHAFELGGAEALIEKTQQKRAKQLTEDSKDFFLSADYTKNNTVSTILFGQKELELSEPLIRLNSPDVLLLRFDDLDGGLKDYGYTLELRQADWSPSELDPFEYLEGFPHERIYDYEHSFNTRVGYTHYRLEIPNSQMRPRLAGNYLLIVYENGNPEDVVFTRRMMVLDQQVRIEASASMADLIPFRDTHQQIRFQVDVSALRVANPFHEIKTTIVQNQRRDNAISQLPPRGVTGNLLIYDYEVESLFAGGNEFRRFDIRNLRFSTERVAEIRSSARHWDVYLQNDLRRNFRRYTTDSDINGRFLVFSQDARNSHTEADYAWVNFSLPMPAPLDAEVYVLGGLTEWRFDQTNQMNYNYSEKKYELSLLLKQGYYNYMYAVRESGSDKFDAGYIEGDHSETENEYRIYIYHRAAGERYDRLVGMTNFVSHR